MNNIVIIGAGISGLTLAHELSKKNKKFNISVYEKDKIPGGMAKSIRDKNNIPSEHSWRGFGPFYYNLNRILKEIPIKLEQFTHKLQKFTIDEIKKHNSENDLWVYHDNNVYDITKFIDKHPGGSVILNSIDNQDLNNLWEQFGVEWHNNIIDQMSEYKIGEIIENFSNKNVYDNLNKKKINFKLFSNKDEIYSPPFIHKKDFLYLYYLYYKVSSSDKRKQYFFKKKLIPYIKNYISNDSFKYIIDFLSGPGYGFDPNSLSVAHFVLFIEHVFNSPKNDFWKTFNGPINEVWFDPWIAHLKNNGVKFFFEHKLDKINHSNNKIDSLNIIHEKNIKKIYSDDFIFCINPNNYYDILKKSNIENLSKKYLKLGVSNNQISFRIGFSKEIKFNEKFLGIILYDSPYRITLHSYNNHWDKKYNFGKNKNLKTLWSGTLVTTYIKGKLFNKTATSLNKKELIQEIIFQIKESKQFMNFIKKNNNFNFSEKDIIHSEIFEDWIFKNNRLVTKNKKWINTYYNEKYRHNNYTDFENLYTSGSHTKTSVNLWLMESAVESSLLTTNIIFKKYKIKNISIFTHESNTFIQFLKILDNLLYNIYFINIIDFIIICILFYIIIKIKNRYK